ncbi:unnamed protein product [Thelazia callipaeda]|uniref:RanBP2-type domain-containing protein n=1 Tax=Thelazia callipaeda TaxID=103827 RepID=A0A0N5D9C6_THECL|nr:unnamed protein product [Thelazia callipaeda]
MQYQYNSGIDYRRRPSHLIINSIKRLRPLKANGIITETFERHMQEKQHQREPLVMNAYESKTFRHRLQNALEKAYAQSTSSKSFNKIYKKSNVLPRAVSPFLQLSNTEYDDDKPVNVQPTLKPTIATTVSVQSETLKSWRPVSETESSSETEGGKARQNRIQARRRKLGPLVKSLRNPYPRRNWHRIIIADNDSLRFSDTVRNIVEQRLRQLAAQRLAKNHHTANAMKGKRPHTSEITLSNARKSDDEANELSTIERVQPTTAITVTSSNTISDIDFDTETTSSNTNDNISTMIPRTIHTTTTKSVSTTDANNATSTTATTLSESSSSRALGLKNAAVINSKALSLSTSQNDYHFRRIPPPKKFKFTQKFRRQPRLRIRKPDESGPLRGNQTSLGRNPIILPHLAPLRHENKDQQAISTNNANGFSRESGHNFEILKHSDESTTTTTATARFDSSNMPIEDLSLTSHTTGSTDNSESNSSKFTFNKSDLIQFGGGKPPPVDFNQANIGIFSSSDDNKSEEQALPAKSADDKEMKSTTASEAFTDDPAYIRSRASPSPSSFEDGQETLETKNSGLLAASPPPDFAGEFGTGIGKPSHAVSFGSGPPPEAPGEYYNEIEDSIFTGDSALTPNRAGPTGDGLGPPILSGAAIPPPVPAVGIGGAAAGIPPSAANDFFRSTENPPSTIKPSALLSVLNKADIGFNQAINHFEQGTPIESAAIDILEVALGSEKLDSQAKLLGHIDRTIGIDNLQRLQRWANTGGALDALKDQLMKIAKNYSPPENLIPTVPPQFQYLFNP